MFCINVFALPLCTQKATLLMLEKNIDEGRIINISSKAAHNSMPILQFYSASKAMARLITEGFRYELRTSNSHTIVIISPGLVSPDLVDDTHFDVAKERQALVTKDVAQLCSVDSQDTTLSGHL